MKILQTLYILWVWFVFIALYVAIMILTFLFMALVFVGAVLMFKNPVEITSYAYKEYFIGEMAYGFPAFNFIDKIKGVWRDE